MLPEGLAARLATQLECVPWLLQNAKPGALLRQPAPGTWSAREHLAHLARYQEMFLGDRLEQMLTVDRPVFIRYRAESDSDWPRWQEMTLEETVAKLEAGRRLLSDRLNGLSNEQLERSGVHPAFGQMTILKWVEFFLLHEAHHLYVATTRSTG